MKTTVRNQRLCERVQGILVPTQQGTGLGLLTPAGELLRLKPQDKTRALESLLGESLEITGYIQPQSKKQKSLHVLTYSHALGPPEWTEGPLIA